ncbi:MAG: hypothetical protein WDA75_22860 [Candidatus Latescibacterota bacterium]|jgi:hypothetical protein
MTRLEFERFYPSAAGAIAAGAAVLLPVWEHRPCNDDILLAILNLAGVLIGFAAAAKALLYAACDRPSIKKLREFTPPRYRRTYFDILVSYAGAPFYWSAGTLVLCLAALLLDQDHFLQAPLPPALACCLTAGLFSFERLMRLLLSLLRGH